MKYLENFSNTIYKTMSARFTASRRMKRSRDASKVCETMFSASIIAISLIALQNPEKEVADMISAFTIILSTFLLVLSLLFSGLNYDKRMENYHACGNELNRLYRLIKHDINVLCDEEQEKKEIDYRVYDSETNLTITDKMISLLISIIKKSGENRKSLEMVVDSICEGAKDFEYNEILEKSKNKKW